MPHGNRVTFGGPPPSIDTKLKGPSRRVERGGRSVTDLTTRRAPERPEPGPPPGLPDGYERMPADPASALPEGVSLTRLIALARLTAPQALEVGAGVLTEVAKRWGPDTGSPGSDPVMLDQAVIGAAGRGVPGPAPGF